MKNKFYLFWFLIIIVNACSKENTEMKDALTNNENSTSIAELSSNVKDSLLLMESKTCINELLSDRVKDSLESIILSDLKRRGSAKSVTIYDSPEYYDATHKIHLKIFMRTTPTLQHYPSLESPVPLDWVVVGGGVRTVLPNGYDAKAYITESRPSLTLTSWIGSSKDHIVSEEHYLEVYAIGMKMDGVAPEYLRSKIHVRSKVSVIANHPVDTIKVPSSCLRLGGGAKVNWTGYGNLLYISIPYGDERTWMVKSKDHRYQSPCTITSYIIGIDNINFPNVGYLAVDTTYQKTYVSYGWSYISTPNRLNYALTCPGGHADYYSSSYGRLLTQMNPINLISYQKSEILSRDCYWSSPGYTRAYAICIKAIN